MTAGLVAGAVGLAALVASSCPPARIECGPGSEVFRTVDTIQLGDTLLRISRLDSIRCERFELELQEPEDTTEAQELRR
jgi:hypothetical protein